LPLRSEHFPVEARGREIVTRHGVIIATAADPAMGEEIARRLNGSDLSDQRINGRSECSRAEQRDLNG
jgi:hypothetical protein